MPETPEKSTPNQSCAMESALDRADKTADSSWRVARLESEQSEVESLRAQLANTHEQLQVAKGNALSILAMKDASDDHAIELEAQLAQAQKDTARLCIEKIRHASEGDMDYAVFIIQREFGLEGE